MAIVEAEGLEKRFGDTVALRGLDLHVEEGTVLGVLGPNGAGKTTAVRILTTLLRADAGRATVCGHDVRADPDAVRHSIGLTGQYAAIDERLTGRENLVLVGRYFHLPAPEARRRADSLLERFELIDAANRVAKGYSGGMRRRLDIAMSLIGEPSVLFLDEPTTGLDPRSRMAMWDLIGELTRQGMTTLLTTQYLDEADMLADEIAVVDHGTVIARGTSAELKARVGGSRVSVTLAPDGPDGPEGRDGPAGGVLGRARDALSGLGLKDLRHDTTSPDGGPVLSAAVAELSGLVASVVRALDAADVDPLDVDVRHPTLDDVFLTLTGHRAEETDGADGADGADRADRDSGAEGSDATTKAGRRRRKRHDGDRAAESASSGEVTR